MTQNRQEKISSSVCPLLILRGRIRYNNPSRLYGDFALYHPFRQYQGTQAHFQVAHGIIEIQAFVHHISDFLNVARSNGFHPEEFKEWWHEADQKFFEKKFDKEEIMCYNVNTVKLDYSVNTG